MHKRTRKNAHWTRTATRAWVATGWVIICMAVCSGGSGRYGARVLAGDGEGQQMPAMPSGGVHFAPTVENRGKPGKPVPAGMAFIPGGEFSMGAAEEPGGGHVGMQATVDARPVHRVYVDAFFMDKKDVTNAEFEAFVKATGYVTIAERKPTPEQYPTAPPENLVAGSVVFTPPDHPVPLNDQFQWWAYVPGANWRHPLGPKSDLRAEVSSHRIRQAY